MLNKFGLEICYLTIAITHHSKPNQNSVKTIIISGGPEATNATA